MGIPTFITFLLFTAYNVSAQFNGRVEFLCPPPATVSATSYVQPTGQFVVPAVIKPLIGADMISQPPSVASYPQPNYFNAPFMPPPMPIFMGGSKNDDLHHLLYFLIFANMRNSWGGYGNNGYGYCGGCGGCGNSGCGCDNGCNNYGGDCGCNGNDVTYVPYPVPVPMNSLPFYPGLTSGTVDASQFPDQISSYPGATIQAYGGRDPNEISLVIRTESCN